MRPGASQPCAATHEQCYSSCFGDRGAREDLAGYWYGKNIHPDDKCWDNCVLVGARRRKEHDHYHQYENLIFFTRVFTCRPLHASSLPIGGSLPQASYSLTCTEQLDCASLLIRFACDSCEHFWHAPGQRPPCLQTLRFQFSGFEGKMNSVLPQ